MNEISLILKNFPKDREEKRSIITSLITGFNALAYEGLSSVCIIKDKMPYTKHS